MRLPSRTKRCSAQWNVFGKIKLEAEIRSLDSKDDRSSFDCGVALLNDWLQKVAKQHQEKNLSRTFVAILPSDPHRIAGYYALAATSVETEGMSGKKLPRNVSAVLLARLAVYKNNKGKGLTESPLAYAPTPLVIP